MQRFRLLLFLVSPSLSSLTASIMLSVILLLLSNWHLISQSSLLGQYFAGEYGLLFLTEQVESLIGQTLSSITTYNIIAIIFSIFVGLVVYAITVIVRYMIFELEVLHDEIAYANRANRPSIRLTYELRFLLRSISLGGWIAYLFVYVHLIVPFCVRLTAHIPVLSSGGWRWIVAGSVLILGTHLHFIFMRLIALRPRLAHGSAAMPTKYRR